MFFSNLPNLANWLILLVSPPYLFFSLPTRPIARSLSIFSSDPRMPTSPAPPCSDFMSFTLLDFMVVGGDHLRYRIAAVRAEAFRRRLPGRHANLIVRAP